MRIPSPPPDLTRLFGNLKPNALPAALQQEAYRAFARRCDGRYYHWHKVRMIARAEGLEPELAWAVIKLGRMSAARTLPFTSTKSETLTYSVPDEAQRELMLIDQQLAGRIAFDDHNVITSEQRERYIVNSLMEEAVASSMLEGAATTRREAKDMLRRNRRPRHQGEQMVLNNYVVIQHIRENRQLEFTPERIIDLQRMLGADTMPTEDVGRLRSPADRVIVEDALGETVHEPPMAEELPHRLRVLCDFANESPESAPTFFHPVLRAIVLHFQLAYDHPFCDGNGRTARALFYWYMLKHGYWLFEHLPISRLIYRGASQYGRAFLYTETDGFDATYFLAYHLRIIARARKELREYLARKQGELLQMRRLFTQDRDLNHRQHALLHHALNHPDTIYTIESHQRSHNVAYATARSDLLELAKREYLLQERSGNRFEFMAGPRLRGVVGRSGDLAQRADPK